MVPSWQKFWRKIFTAPFTPAPRRPLRRPSARPELEILERRDLLTTFTYLVTTNADSGTGSLRAAITASNLNANQGVNTIDFRMPAQTAGNQLPNNIVLNSPLPAITTSVVIDGTSDPTYGSVAIDGDKVSTAAAVTAGTAVGLTINAAGCTVKGLLVIGFGDDGIVVNTNNNVIQDNIIGYAGGGLGAVANTPNGRGIQVNGTFNTIGGTTATTRNVIADNNAAGVALAGAHNTLLGNYIGVLSDGLTASGNATGVLVLNGNEVIGGISTADANVISGNKGYGIVIGQAGVSGVTNDDVFDNLIGLSANGKTGVGNGSGGVELLAGANNNLVNNNTIDDNGGPGVFVTGAGTNTNSINGDDIGFLPSNNQPVGNFGDGVLLFAGAQNNIVGTAQDPDILSGNALYGIGISGAGTNDNTVAYDFIGTDPTGMTALGNGSGGVFIGGGASSNVIGGAGVGNIISGNLGDGVSLTTAATINYVLGNTIGVNAAGNAVLANTGDGVFIGAGANSNYIGFNAANAGNVISGNTQAGVEIDGVGADTNLIYGDFIGTNAGGTGAMPNLNGVLIHGLASGNYIGGTGTNEADCISGNTKNGVTISDAGTTGNLILGDQIGTNSAGTTALPNGADGVLIDAGATSNNIGANVAFQGNLIAGNGGDGIDIRDSGTSQNVVVANLIGTNLADNSALPNGAGVVIELGAADNTIGGTAAGDNNVISGNAGSGVTISGDTLPGNFIEGNEIGTNQNGTSALPNQQNGVLLEVGAASNTVSGNLISGNMQDGILITQAGSNSNTIEGNTIGLNAAGTAALGNHYDGVSIFSGSVNIIGGNTAAERNIISGNVGDGVEIIGAGATTNFVIGNFIGTNAAGSAILANGGDGVDLQGGAVNTLVGEAAVAGSGNLISGNANAGVEIYGENAGLGNATGNTIESNRIGTDVTGTIAFANAVAGVLIHNGAANNTVSNDLISGNKYGVEISDLDTTSNIVTGCLIGTNGAGTEALANTSAGVALFSTTTDNTIGPGNIISGNLGYGVVISGAGTNGNQVVSNYIGTLADGFTPLGNPTGILIASGASNNVIGGADKGNVIADNSYAGVAVLGAGSVFNTISQNAIFSDGGLGIDLGDTGVPSTNIAGGFSSAHVGPNNLQNYPVLSDGSTPGSINATLNSTPNTTFTIEFFGNSTSDFAEPGEGRDYLGSVKVTTDAAGNASFSFSFTPTATDPYVTATATDQFGDTSEFSASLDPGLTANGLALTGTVGDLFAGSVATFTGVNSNSQDNEYTAMIYWGDGQSSLGTIVPGVFGGPIAHDVTTYTVSGSHTYTSEAPLLGVTVLINDIYGHGQVEAHSTMNLVYGLTGIPDTVPFIEGIGPTNPSSSESSGRDFNETGASSGPVVVASFFDADPHAFAGLYTATINWGDAAAGASVDTSIGAITADGSAFDVLGNHIYAEAGTYPMTVTVQDAFGASVVINSTAVVALQPLALEGVSVAVPANSTFNGIVATLYDPDPRSDPTFYTATVTWDDGTTSAGTVTGSNPFTITASHNFGTFDNTAIETVTVTDKLGRTATVSDRFVDPPGTETPAEGTAGVKYDHTIAIAGGTKPGTPVTLGDFADGGTGLTAAAITINAAAGTMVVNGKPTAAGTASYTLNLTDAAGSDVTEEFSITVNAALAIGNLSATQWTAGSAGFTGVSIISGGTGPFTLAGATALPAGLKVVLTGTTIHFTGTPTTPHAYATQVTIRDAAGASVTQTLHITIAPRPTIGNLTATQWTVGVPGFTGVSTIGGGTGPFGITRAVGLPTGMTAIVTGNTISFTGAPTIAKTYVADITIHDATGASVTKAFAIKINAAPTVSNLTTTQWTVDKPGFTGTLTVAGGTGSYVIASVSGLPTGMTAVVVGHKIHFTGTPSAAQSFADANITLQDAAGASVTKTFRITINPAV